MSMNGGTAIPEMPPSILIAVTPRPSGAENGTVEKFPVLPSVSIVAPPA